MKAFEFNWRKWIAFLSAVLLVSSAVSAQDLKFKASLSSKRPTKEFSFQTKSFTGEISASNSEMILDIKNNSESVQLISPGISLEDVSKRSINLCSENTISLEPNKKVHIALKNCKDKRGLFFLKPYYNTKSEFKENSLFLIDKKWTLFVGNEPITFYTSY